MMIFKLYYLFDLVYGKEENNRILYQIPGRDMYAEFSNEESKRLVEEDFAKFPELGNYRKLKLEDLDEKDPLYGARVTQQLYR